MKRLFAIFLVALGTIFSAQAETSGFYINNNPINVTDLSQVPVVDATNFVNRNLFQLQLFADFSGIPYDFSNVENFTNNNVMSSTPVGFRFDTAVTATGLRKPARNFVNAGPAPNQNNASISAGNWLQVEATNIINRGLMSVGSSGLIALKGDNITADRSSFQIGSAFNGNSSGQYDVYWGLGTNRLVPSVNLTATAPFTPPHAVESLQVFNFGGDPFYTYVTGPTSVPQFGSFGTPGLTARSVQSAGTSNLAVQIVFLYNTNVNISTTVKFSTNNLPGTLGAATIEWRSSVSNVVNGKITTNLLYLTDNINSIATNTLIQHFPNGVPPPTYAPSNFVFSGFTPISFIFGSLGSTYTTPPPSFWGTNAVTIVSNTYAAYGLRLSAATAEPATSVSGYQSVPGQLDLDASKNLSLNQVTIEGANYTRINGAKNFQGSSNASISTVTADISLGSTNGFLNVANILLPAIPRYTGEIDVYSGVWTNSVLDSSGTNTIPVTYNVLFVDSSTLNYFVTPQVLSLGLDATNLVINDQFNIYSNLSVNAENMTIAASGGIGLFSASENWASSIPYLKNFTNHGAVSGVDTLYIFGSGQAQDGSDLPYGSLVNNGNITTPGLNIASRYLENRGTLATTTGAIELGGSNVFLLPTATTNQAILTAPNSDVLITAQNLIISNQVIRAGRSISLWPGATIADGFPAVTNRLSVGDGFNLFVKPPVGDLRYTVVSNRSSAYGSVPNWWAGEDRGFTAAGFTNNVALGKLVLNGGTNSSFIFYPAGESNALYVGTLELDGYASLTNASGDLYGVQIAPGMKIYYSYLRINGSSVSPALLNGKNGGGFNYVSSYTGPDIAAASTVSETTVYDYDVDLRVAAGVPAGSAVIVSWNTVSGVTNKLYYKDTLLSPDWQLLFSGVSAASGRAEYPDAVGSAGRVYRVQLDFPNP